MNPGLRFGPFALDVTRRSLTRDGATVHLTPRAFDLLWLLASSDGIVSKEAIMSAVWPGLVVEENNLTVTIAAIRRALGDSARTPDYIRTRPGIGYEFVAAREPLHPALLTAGYSVQPHLSRTAWRLSAAAAVLVAITVFVTLALQSHVASTALPPAAHRELIAGYNAMYKRTADGNREALAAFGRAAGLAPGPTTWSALAEGYYSEAVFQFSDRTPLAAFRDARTYVRRALAADPDDAHALWLDAALRFYLERDWRGARTAFERALAANPSSAAARRTFAWLLLTVGDTAAAEEQARLAQRLEPANANISSVLGVLAYCSGDLDGAMSEFSAAGELSPGYFRHFVERGRIASVLGRFDAALGDLGAARARMGDDPEILGSLGYTYGRMGRADDARAMLALLARKSRVSYVSPFQFGLVHLGLGETATAEREFQRAYDDHSFWLPWLECDRRLDRIAKFRDGLLRQLSLPQLASLAHERVARNDAPAR